MKPNGSKRKLGPKSELVVWLIWIAVGLVTAYVLLYYIGYYVGDVGK